MIKLLTILAIAAFNLSLALAADNDLAPRNRASTLGPEQVALVINDADPSSVRAGDYYRATRGIPAENVVHVSIKNAPNRLSLAEFTSLQAEIEAQLNPKEQVMLLAWTAPYAVECKDRKSVV